MKEEFLIGAIFLLHLILFHHVRAVEPRLCTLSILVLLIEQDICILMYNVKHNSCPRTICDMFLTNIQTYNLQQKDFYQPSFNTVTHEKHSIRYLGPRLWSKVPSKDRSAASLKQFKTRMRSLDLSNILNGCDGCNLCNL